jgi:hypothetical protein
VPNAKLPKTLYVGHFDFDVTQQRVFDKLGETIYGESEKDPAGIKILKGQSPANKRDTLMHESLHAILYAAGGHVLLPLNHDDEERLIRFLSPWLVALLRDNPDFVDFITDGAYG